MKRLLLLVLMLQSATLFAQNANVKYSGNAKPGNKVYSCAYEGYVNMRPGPSYEAPKLTIKFKNGSTGAVLIQNLGEWMKIDYNGKEAYIPSRFVQDEPTVAYTGNATASEIAGVWNVRGPYNIINIYDNGYWMAFGNYFPLAYGYYIMQNNEVKLIATEKSDGGEPKYESVKEVYDIIDINSLNKETRIEFLTENETNDEIAVEPYYCTKEKFKENAKSVAKRVSEHIKKLSSR